MANEKMLKDKANARIRMQQDLKGFQTSDRAALSEVREGVVEVVKWINGNDPEPETITVEVFSFKAFAHWLNYTDAGACTAGATYVLVGLLTFGSRAALWARVDMSNYLPAIVSGVLWPIYWLGHIALAVFW